MTAVKEDEVTSVNKILIDLTSLVNCLGGKNTVEPQTPAEYEHLVIMGSGFIFLKAWSNRVTSRHNENFCLLASPFGQYLCALALTCDDFVHFGQDQLCIQVFSPFDHSMQILLHI